MNWLEEKVKRNGEYAVKMLPVIKRLKEIFPGEPSLDRAEEMLQQESFDDDLDVKIRSQINAIAVKKEKELIELKDFLYKAADIKFDVSKGDKYDAEDCFLPGFDFKILDRIYYFRLPKLKFSKDKLSKTEHMLDRYLRDAITESLERYQIGRPTFECFETFTIIFIHYFKEEDSDRFDTDNIDIGKAINAVNGILIQNDTIARSHIIQITKPSDTEYTEMYILKGHYLGGRITELLEAQKTAKKPD